MITENRIINKIKNKDFTISYEDAIDLSKIMDIDYFWEEETGGKSHLMHIKINLFSGVKLIINNRGPV